MGDCTPDIFNLRKNIEVTKKMFRAAEGEGRSVVRGREQK